MTYIYIVILVIYSLVTLFSDIVMATSRARQRNGVVRRCAKAPHNVQNIARAAEKSVITTRY